MYCETRSGRFEGNLYEILDSSTSHFNRATPFSEREIVRYYMRKGDTTGIYLLTVSLFATTGSPGSDNLSISVMGNEERTATRLADDLEARLGITMTKSIVYPRVKNNTMLRPVSAAGESTSLSATYLG